MTFNSLNNPDIISSRISAPAVVFLQYKVLLPATVQIFSVSVKVKPLIVKSPAIIFPFATCKLVIELSKEISPLVKFATVISAPSA